MSKIVLGFLQYILYKNDMAGMIKLKQLIFVLYLYLNIHPLAVTFPSFYLI